MNREQRIDIVRGIAIVTILLNHFAMAYRAVGYGGAQILTPTQLGYSSAASLFVALSGYMVGMVYLGREQPVRKILRRAIDLYLLNLALFAIVSPAALLADPARDRFWNMQRLLNDPVDGVLRFLTLRDAPAFLDVLQLYIVLLAMTPLAMLLLRRSAWLLIGCSVALWAAIQLWPFVLPREFPVPRIGRSLNPLAWQMAFFLPMIAGTKRWHEPIFAWFARNRWSVALLVLALAGIAYVHEIDPMFAPARIHLALTDRFSHGPVWTAHALLLLAFYLGALVLLTPWLAAWPFRLLASLGRNSLNVYAASVPVIIALAFAIGWVRTDFAGLVGGTALAVLFCLAVAAWSDARRQRGRHKQTPAAALPA
jgi:hypothetical protein